MQKILPIITLVASLNADAVLGPIPIYLNTEYRTNSPVIGSIASTLSFSADDIKATGANTFLDFLATVPSVGLHKGSVPAIFMRGGDSDHTLVLVDGVSVNSIDSVNGAVEYGLTSIALNDIEKVEIIKGSGSVLYGSGAISGVISITTKKGADGKSATVSTKFGTHNSKRYTFNASSGDKDNFVIFNGSKYTTDGISAKNDNAEQDGIKNNAINLKFGSNIGHVKTTLGISSNNGKTQYDACGFATDDCLNDRSSKKISLIAENEFSDIWHFKSSFSQLSHRRKHYTSGVLEPWSGDKYKSTTVSVLNDIKVDDALFNVGLSQVDDENTTDNKKLSSKDLFVNWQY